MTLKKAYTNLVILLLLAVIAITLFSLNVSSNYIFWQHIAFVIALLITGFVTTYVIFLLQRNPYSFKKTPKKEEFLDYVMFIGTTFTVICVLFMFFFFSSTVRQSSMINTLQSGDIVFVSQFRYEPSRGDIIILNVDTVEHPDQSERLLVKRIAAMPGDLVEFLAIAGTSNYYILINGEIYHADGEDYIARTNAENTIREYSEKDIIEASLDSNGYVKEGEYLVFGDNEFGSYDSRDLGSFKRDAIIGHVVYKIWPFGGVS